MGTKTRIEWTDATWNPLRGCSRVSEGCRNCYAESVAYRFSGAGLPYEGLAVLKNGHASWTGKVDLVEKHLLDPFKWGLVDEFAPNPEDPANPATGGRRMRIFVNSMSDLFHEAVPDEWLDRIFAVMAACPWHIFQVLTKRPARMHAYIESRMRADIFGRVFGLDAEFDRRVRKRVHAAYHPLPNVWLGVSVENQAAADERIEPLLRTPAAVRFLSVEPMLGPVNLNWVGCECDEPDSWDGVIDALGGFTWTEKWDNADGSERTTNRQQTVPKIDWVICGGESGPHARPMHPDWARGLRDQCKAAGAAFFFKQWGEWAPWAPDDYSEPKGTQAVNVDGSATWFAGSDGQLTNWLTNYSEGAAAITRVGKHAAGASLDGVKHEAFPEVRA